MNPEYIRKNILLSEARCPHCGALPSNEYLDFFQDLRDACGFALPFTSMYRCPTYNTIIGGSSTSLHLLGAAPGPSGAADIGLDKTNGRKRMTIVTEAFKLGMNSLEIADQHIHIGIAPDSHAQKDKLYWGISQ